MPVHKRLHHGHYHLPFGTFLTRYYAIGCSTLGHDERIPVPHSHTKTAQRREQHCRLGQRPGMVQLTDLSNFGMVHHGIIARGPLLSGAAGPDSLINTGI